MIPVEHDVARWRAVYRKRYGHDPPLRLEALKKLNRALISGLPRTIAAKISLNPKRKRRGRAPWSIKPLEMCEILEEYDRGDLFSAIAAKHGCGIRYVRRIARRAGRVGRVVGRE